MADLSKMSDAELRAQYQSMKTASAPIKDMSDEELIALHKKGSAVEPQTPKQPQASETPIADRINAIGGGIAGGLVKTGAAVGRLGTDIAEQTGIISPETKQTLRAGGAAIGDALTPKPDSIPGQAMQQHPNFATGGDVLGQVAPYAVPGLGASAGANYALAGVAGAASTDDGFLNRVVGGTGGMATAGLINAGASALQSGVSALRATSVVKQAEKYVAEKVASLAKTLGGSPREIGAQSAANVFNETRKVDSEMFDAFRKVPGDVAPELRQVKRAMEDMLDQYGANMSGAQRQAIESGLKQFDKGASLADLHDLRKMIVKNGQVFGPHDGPIFSAAYDDLKKVVNTQMELGATKLNVLPEFKNANTHFQEKMLPLINANTDDVAMALSEQGLKTNPTGAAKIMDEWVDKNIRLNKPNETKAFLKTLDPVGREAVEIRLIQKTLEQTQNAKNIPLAFKNQFQKYGASADILLSGANKKLMDGTMRVLTEATPLLENTLKKGELINMPVQATIGLLTKATSTAPGQFILKMLGEPSTPKSLIKEFLTKGSAIVGGDFSADVGSNVYDKLNEPTLPVGQ